MPDLTPAFSDPTTPCPECGGPLLRRHPAGMVYRHNTLAGCSLQDAEDARLVADRGLHGWRPSTSTERTLLAAAGGTVASGKTVVDDSTVLVEWPSPGLRRRSWLVA